MPWLALLGSVDLILSRMGNLFSWLRSFLRNEKCTICFAWVDRGESVCSEECERIMEDSRVW